jgi:isoleucyl-tRNA synthetase
MRFLLGNLFDFDPARDSVAVEQLSDDDRWVLQQLHSLVEKVTDAYEKFEFHRVYHAVNGFCVTELGSLYLDAAKDRLYCSTPGDKVRRASQTVQYEIASALARLLAPVLPFTADEAWEMLPGAKAESVHLAAFPVAPQSGRDAALDERFVRLLALRAQVTAAMEPLRQGKEKLIGSSTDAAVVLRSKDPETLAFLRANLELMKSFFIVSQIVIEEGIAEGIATELRESGLHLAVEVRKASGEKCPRCWTWSEEVGQDTEHPGLCPRCADAVRRSTSNGN